MTRFRDKLSLSAILSRISLPSTPSARTGLSLAVRGLLIAAAVTIVALSSTLLYTIFYKLYVPQLLHQAPVYLQYPASSAENTTAIVNFVPASDYKFLSTSQAYSVSVDLHVPTSETNRRMGNFMVILELQNRYGKAVHQSARPSILPYQSPAVQIMQTFVRAIPLALGISQESTHLHIPLIETVYDKHFSPITNACIVLTKPIEVYQAYITIRARFSGLRYWMYYWKIPTALAFIVAGASWQLLLTAVAWSVLEPYVSRSRRLHADMLPSASDTSLASRASQQSPHSQPSSMPGSPLVRALSFFDQQSVPSDDEFDEQNVPDNSGLEQPLSAPTRSSSSRASLRRRTSGLSLGVRKPS
ncbi:hypothetical protein H4R22_003619 [Coemansia sp. RSA 1290]|nr:hypothetical protein H4R22_003619 [Coemansia sp. RSA 1290]